MQAFADQQSKRGLATAAKLLVLIINKTSPGLVTQLH